ncbi:uncharacterized protein LOC128261129 [Drosophila gunungcola]|uniref:uncharacterized protein LOC128261129 n=1 Tax=Drosophila gunungcola TaxID=103775 RepID=UPI0022DFC212|nr:uncharacterized protein LOC128261129 [Drosophila gunungcola]
MSIIGLLFFGLCLSSAQALLVPQHNCDNHFRYATEDSGRTYMGIFTAPKSNNHNFKWQAIFEVQGYRSLFVSALLTYPNNEEAADYLLKGEPAQAYVRFVDVTTELPKLYSLILNGNELCFNAGYPFPKTRATVRHHMYINVKKTVRKHTTQVYPPYQNNVRSF